MSTQNLNVFDNRNYQKITRSGMLYRFSLASDSQVEGLVQEADRHVYAVSLTLIPSPNIDEHN